MSASVERMQAQANEVAALVKEAREFRITSLTMILMLGLGLPSRMINNEMENLKASEKRLGEALKPFEPEAA